MAAGHSPANIARTSFCSTVRKAQHFKHQVLLSPKAYRAYSYCIKFIMEAGLAAGYAAETAVEGAVGAGIALAQATMPLKASWKRIPLADSLPRSSHSLSIVKGVAYIFGGEIRPREPVDNDIHSISLPSSGNISADYKVIPAAGTEIPQARVGHTANAIDDKIYVFGGRGGKEMTPLAEKGRVWVFDTVSKKWAFLDPSEGSSYPEPRSYHASAATAYPLHTSVDQLESRFDPLPVDSQAHGTLDIPSVGDGSCLD